MLEDNLKAQTKPQYVDQIPRALKPEQKTLSVSKLLDMNNQLENKQFMCDELELNDVLERRAEELSGGELQRFAIAASCIRKADVCVISFIITNATH